MPQNRERVYTVGHLRNRGAAKIFPITGAGGENCSQQLGNYLPTRTRANPNQGRIYSIEGIAPCLNKMDGGGSEPSVAIPFFMDLNMGAGIKETEFARCLQSRYQKGITTFKGGISGIGIPISDDDIDTKALFNQRGVVHSVNGISRTLIGCGHSGNEPKVAIPVLTPERAKKRQNGRRFKENEDPMFTLTGQDRHGVGVGIDDICIDLKSFSSSTRGQPYRHGFSATLDHNCYQGIFVRVSDELTIYAIWYEKYQCYIAIRKLTPKECFRLQGWTDIYFERAQLVNSDSQLYKQAGNGVTVNVVYEIGKAITAVERRRHAGSIREDHSQTWN